jgi:3-hydroxyisobutyrate dehydrogenase-like beta-hydroxyacid dehydrogenase
MAGLILGFIGFGEAAHAICMGLLETTRPEIHAYDVQWNDPVAGSLVKARAGQAGVVLEPGPADLFRVCNVVLCATSAKLALPIAKEMAGFFSSEVLYADLNSSAPSVKQEIAAIAAAKGALFVDAAVMEIVPPHRHRVQIAASGSGAREFTDLLNDLGMNISYISDEAGSSSTMKMLRSVFMKGLTSLLLETLVAANKTGITKPVMASITETLDGSGLQAVANLLLNRTAVAAERRVSEMKDAVATLTSLGLPAWSSEATVRRLQWLCDIGLKKELDGVAPAHYDKVLDAIAGCLASGKHAIHDQEEQR